MSEGQRLERFFVDLDFRTNRASLVGVERTIGGVLGRIDARAAAVGAAFVAVGAGITAALASSVQKSIEWETSFTGVRKTVDASEATFAKLERQLLKLSTTDVPIDPNELAGVAEAAGQLGIHTPYIVDFTETMAQLGVTTNLSSGEAATSLARFANVTGMSQDLFDRLGSTIVHLGNNFATTEAEIVAMASRMAGTGTTIGLVQSEILGFATALSSVGIQAELGGTAFSRIAGEMQKAVEAGGPALQGFADIAGMSADAFARLFRDAPADALIAFIGGVRQMREEGQAVIEPLEELGFSGVRVRETILKSATAFDLMRDAVAGAGEAWEENTALGKEAELRFGTTASQIEFLSNAFERLGIVLARETGADSAFASMIASITSAVNSLTDALEGTPPQIINPEVAPLPDEGLTGVGRRRRRRGQQAQDVDFGDWLDAVLGVIPQPRTAGLTPIQARRRRRYFQTYGQQPSGYGALFTGDTSPGLTIPDDPFPDDPIPAVLQASRLLALQSRETAPAIRDVAAEFSGLDEHLSRLPVGKVAEDVEDLALNFDIIHANILGFDVAADESGYAIQLAGTRTQRWSQGLANLSGVLINIAGSTGEFTRTVLSLIEGYGTGGPLGMLAVGLQTLWNGLVGSRQASEETARALREAAWAERERIAAIRGGLAQSTADILFQHRQRTDPEGVAAEQAGIFGLFGDLIEGMPIEQVLKWLGSYDLLRSDQDVGISDLGYSADELPALIQFFDRLRELFPDLAGAFGDISFLELADNFLQFISPPEGASAFDASPPPAAAGNGLQITVTVGEVKVEVAEGDPEVIAASVGEELNAALTYYIPNNVAEDFDTEVDR